MTIDPFSTKWVANPFQQHISHQRIWRCVQPFCRNQQLGCAHPFCSWHPFYTTKWGAQPHLVNWKGDLFLAHVHGHLEGGQGVPKKGHLLFYPFSSSVVFLIFYGFSYLYTCISYTYLSMALRPLPIKPQRWGKFDKWRHKAPFQLSKLVCLRFLVRFFGPDGHISTWFMEILKGLFWRFWTSRRSP